MFTTYKTKGQPTTAECYPVTGVEAVAVGEALVLSSGKLTKSGAPAAPAFIALEPCTGAEATAAELDWQLESLERREIAGASIRDWGAAIVCPDLAAAVEIANQVAPEHLEIMTKEPRAVLPLIRNAGAVFLGAWTPEPLGDYLAGPSHVLPTSGSARFFSPIGVDSFLKRMSVIEYTRDALAEEASDITALAYTEKLTAHAHAVEVRV